MIDLQSYYIYARKKVNDGVVDSPQQEIESFFLRGRQGVNPSDFCIITQLATYAVSLLRYARNDTA
jgi:hypothetical protein